ncbi:MAG TPA: hypothetical protein EYP98_17445 [Planctomycetes bacterium]|nr:hypothetical protein [Planctomycetota bacterium]
MFSTDPLSLCVEIAPPPPLPLCASVGRAASCARVRAHILMTYVMERGLRGQKVSVLDISAAMGVSRRRWYDFAAVLSTLGWGVRRSKNTFQFARRFVVCFTAFSQPPELTGTSTALTTYALMHMLCTTGSILREDGHSQRRVYDVLLVLEGLNVVERASNRRYCSPQLTLI